MGGNGPFGFRYIKYEVLVSYTLQLDLCAGAYRETRSHCGYSYLKPETRICWVWRRPALRVVGTQGSREVGQVPEGESVSREAPLNFKSEWCRS